MDRILFIPFVLPGTQGAGREGQGYTVFVVFFHSHPPSLPSIHLDGSLGPRGSLQGPHLTLEDGRTDWRGYRG